MINNPELINKVISQIKSLAVEKIDKIMQKGDEEFGYIVIEPETKYVQNTEYSFNSSILICETIHKKENIFKRMFNKKEKNINSLEDAA